ncbi:septum site-determining protein MinC [Chroococcidiopsis sp. TS-821]|uniref:septum site-determining protein MinC n=1 Tax=Chroococcidiopsis sp. TS-821 TaxID=1378066 RepID=UPI000D483240|nr:septum site-determining protein MinC [Chroococcidiopsis sp. TS-821]PPS43427.1 septum site-determining protein MinC [Chroococcidiopsis sp. TS-821]
MTDSALPEIETTLTPPSTNIANNNLQVRLKGEGEHLLLILPTEVESSATATTWSDLWQQLKQRLNGGDRFWQPNTVVHLMATDRLLDTRQLQAIADALTEAQLQLTHVFTSRRQTAVAAATAGYSVEQQAPITRLHQTANTAPTPLAEPLYLQMTVRSGIEIRHAGSVIVLGDLNPGGTVVANGDILVWGRLRGVAHAGAAGNSKCLIMALQMEPTQLRIAEFVARAPTNIPSQFYPEVAYVAPEGIRIAKAADFSKSQFSLPS